MEYEVCEASEEDLDELEDYVDDDDEGDAEPAPGLSAEQESAVSAIMEGIGRGGRVQTLGGYAGTGKSTCIRAMQERLPGAAVLAYTGKAAAVLRRKGVDASTIHSLIYMPWAEGKKIKWVLREKLSPAIKAIIVDEASMVGEKVYEDLLSFNRPLVFVGDHGQLEPIEGTLNLMREPQYVLEKIHRNSGDIARFAEWLRLGNDAKDFDGDDDSVTILEPGDITHKLMAGADQMICAFNQTRVKFNAIARECFGRTGLVEVGERVMCLRNNHVLGLYNGMQGVVRRVGELVTKKRGRKKEESLTIDFESDVGMHGDLVVDPAQFGRQKGPERGERDKPVHAFDYGYCVTCHKAQGDEWPVVYVREQRCSHFDPVRWAYTAASRAQKKLYWVPGTEAYF